MPYTCLIQEGGNHLVDDAEHDSENNRAAKLRRSRLSNQLEQYNDLRSSLRKKSQVKKVKDADKILQSKTLASNNNSIT